MTSPQKPLVSNTLDPHQPAVPAGLPRWCLLTWQASVMWWVYNECMSTMNACLQWMHELHQHYSSQNSSVLPAKGWANGFSPKRVFCGPHYFTEQTGTDRNRPKRASLFNFTGRNGRYSVPQSYTVQCAHKIPSQ